MSYPFELKYDKNHHWCRLNRDGTVTIGVTSRYVLSIAGYGTDGAVVAVVLPSAGIQLAQGADAGSIEGSIGLSEIYAPIAGTVATPNGDLKGSPVAVRDDPYGEGWLFTIKPANAADLNGLMNAAAYTDFTGQ